MSELINQALNEYFSDFKQYHLIILIAFTLIIALIQLIQSIWVSKKIEKFKSVIKKSEIKFSRYHNLQVDALKSVYDKLVFFHAANSSLFKSKYDSNDHTQFKRRINNWIKAYIECVNAFSLEKILLPNHLKDLVHKTIVDFEEVNNILIYEKEELDFLEESNANWNEMYEFRENELEIINNKIGKLKTKKAIVFSETNIIELRKAIEDYFEEMNN